MKLDIPSARRLTVDALGSNGYSSAEALVIADHLIDSELRGLGYAGLARAVSIIEHDRRCNLVRKGITVLQETPVSARIDGGDDLGYLVASKATEISIEKCRSSGIAVVGAARTHFTGMYSYYLEKVTACGFVGMIAGSGPAMVAPHGGTDALFSTNPIAFGFPAKDADPVIWDISTSSITHAEVLLAGRLGKPLPPSRGFDAFGRATSDARAVLDGGAVAVWGGPRGSGLAMSIQLLSMLAGQRDRADGGEPADFGYFMIVIDPALFDETDDFADRVADFANKMRGSRPLDPDTSVRVPFQRSAAERRHRLELGYIDVPAPVVERLSQLAGQ